MTGAETPEPDDGVARLRERLQATQRAAERLVEGVEHDAQRRPPPAGYAVSDPGPTTSTLEEVAALFRMLRALVPEELARELGDLARELLLLARALIDWLLARLEHRRAQPVQETDIPIA